MLLWAAQARPSFNLHAFARSVQILVAGRSGIVDVGFLFENLLGETRPAASLRPSVRVHPLLQQIRRTGGQFPITRMHCSHPGSVERRRAGGGPVRVSALGRRLREKRTAYSAAARTSTRTPRGEGKRGAAVALATGETRIGEKVSFDYNFRPCALYFTI